MKQKKTGYKFLGILIKRYWFMIVIIIAMSSFDSFTYTYVPLFIKFIFSVLTNDGSFVNLPEWLKSLFNLGGNTLTIVLLTGLGMAIYQLFRALFKIIMGVYRNFVSERVSVNLRKDLYNHIQNLSYAYHNNVDRGDLIQRCTSDIDVVRNFLSRQMAEMLAVFAILGASVYQMYRINPMLTWVSLIIVPVALTSSLWYFLYVQKKYSEIEESEAKLMTIIQENLAAVRVVKAFANEKHEIDKFLEQSVDYSKRNLALNRTASFFWGFGDFSTVMQYLLTITVAIFIMKNNPGTVHPSDIIAILMLVGSFIWPVRGLGRIIGDVGKTSVAAYRLQEIFDIQDEFVNDGKLFPEIKGTIEFKNVSFKFEDAEEFLLRNFNVKINAGETVAIIGKTGSGKSTLAKILTRLHDYQEGSVLIDGVELKEINKKHVRGNIGLILQDPFLFSKTIYENIAITNKNAERGRVEQVAQIASMDQDIKGFEKGYETLVGERGATLSGGQKQRIAIARMLLDEKPILIFDDSLSALDSETDLMIRSALKRNKTATMLIITHKITSAKQADKIIVIENGAVSQIGTHEELAQVDGLYKKLWDIQGELEAEFLKVVHGGGDAS
ncbi:MAG: ABC transporter ATP-binding protein [Bacilli bacterium]